MSGSRWGQSQEDKQREASNSASFSSNLQKNQLGQSAYLDAVNRIADRGAFMGGAATAESPGLSQTILPDMSVQDYALARELESEFGRGDMEAAADLDRFNTRFFTTEDIRRGAASAAEARLGQRVGGEEDRGRLAESGSQDRATRRVTGQEERGNIAETGSQDRATRRVAGQETRGELAEGGAQARATERVSGQEDRGRLAESGSQERATARVGGQEIRETDKQREMFRRFKESKDRADAKADARF